MTPLTPGLWSAGYNGRPPKALDRPPPTAQPPAVSFVPRTKHGGQKRPLVTYQSHKDLPHPRVVVVNPTFPHKLPTPRAVSGDLAQGSNIELCVCFLDMRFETVEFLLGRKRHAHHYSTCSKIQSVQPFVAAEMKSFWAVENDSGICTQDCRALQGPAGLQALQCFLNICSIPSELHDQQSIHAGRISLDA